MLHVNAGGVHSKDIGRESDYDFSCYNGYGKGDEIGVQGGEILPF